MPGPCSNCGDATAQGPQELRFSLEGREPKLLELHLCEACLGELLAEDGIERTGR
jgi:hypothetical protein